jgi:hypothetical protein
VSRCVRGRRLRLPKPCAASSGEYEPFVGHGLDLIASLGVSQEPPFQFEEHFVETTKQILVRTGCQPRSLGVVRAGIVGWPADRHSQSERSSGV